MTETDLFLLHKELSKTFSLEELLAAGKDLSASPTNTNILSTHLTSPLQIFEFTGIAYQRIKDQETLSRTTMRKHLGIYYTPYVIARQMVKDAFSWHTKPLIGTTVFEPSVGSGIFIIAFLDHCVSVDSTLHNQSDLQSLIDTVFAADVDTEAISLSKRLIEDYVKNVYGVSITIPPENFYTGNILFEKNILGSYEKIDPKQIFNQPNGFDIVLANPPYKLLKANADKYHEQDAIENTMLVDALKKQQFFPRNRGTLNLYKLFVEEIAESYVKTSGAFSVIIPSAFLTDKQSEVLRKHLLQTFSIGTIYAIPEKNSFFPDISQGFCFFTATKSTSLDTIGLSGIVPAITSVAELTKAPTPLRNADVLEISDTMPVVTLSQPAWSLLKKMSTHKKLKEYSEIVNLRGEFDLTLHKPYLTSEGTIPLLKGDAIRPFTAASATQFIEERFLKEQPSKASYVAAARLAGQQISNSSQTKRLKFSLIKPGTVLGNSCNFISVTESAESPFSLLYLLGLLNSELLNWRFGITNGNNHVSNYELDELPIPLPTPQERTHIESLVRSLLKSPTGETEAALNDAVEALFGVSKEEVANVLYEKNL